jgi:hypothetical protein
MALNGHQTGDKDSTINKKRARSMGGGWNMMRERRGAWGGGMIRSFPWQPCALSPFSLTRDAARRVGMCKSESKKG